MHVRRALGLFALGLAACGSRDRDQVAPAPASTADAPTVAPPDVTAVPLGSSLRATAGRRGVSLSSALGEGRIATRAVGRAGAMRALGEAAPSALDGRAIYQRPELREWWARRGDALELGYDLAARPAGDGELRVTIDVEGGTPRVTRDGVAAFVDGPDGSAAAPLWSVTDLRANDADGRALPARFTLDQGALALAIDDRGARYPIAIDPIVASGIETKITPAAAVSGFGSVLALSADGAQLAVKNSTNASVLLYARGASGWAAAGSATFPTASGGTDQYGAFGDALGFDDAGDLLAGDIRFSYSSMTWAGAVLAFKKGATPTYAAALKASDAAADKQLGFSVATSGTSILVGARTTSGCCGTAYVFTHGAGTTYTQQAKLATPSGSSYFGWNAAIGGDLAAVSALQQKVWGFRRKAGTSTWDAGKALTPAGAGASDGLGGALAVAGGTLLLGASGHTFNVANDGQVFVYQDTGADLVEQAPMLSDPLPGTSAAKFGASLALSADGKTAFVGAPAAGDGNGRVYALTRGAAGWSLVRAIAPSDPNVVGFGSAVRLAGTVLAVAAPSAGSGGAVFVYDPALGLPAATACTTSTGCASGHCVDGVCCDAPCDGQCEACNVTGFEGTCTPVRGAPVGARAACATSAGDPACASACDGVTRGACTFPDATRSCGPAPSCDGSGALELGGHCDGAGTCAFGATKSCGNFLCALGACPTRCALDTECKDGARCVGSLCVLSPVDAGVPKGSGEFHLCKQDGDCASGHCADGVCCDQPCTDKCWSCSIPGYIGVCLPESGIDLRHDCDASGCNTTCQAGECRPMRAGDQCAPSACVDATTAVGPSVCSAAGGACQVSSATADCAPYTCSLGACLTSCNDSAQCSPGFTCDPDRRQCIMPPLPGSDGGCAVNDRAAASLSGAFCAALGCAAWIARRRRGGSRRTGAPPVRGRL